MSEVRRISQLLKHGYDGQPWYGTAFCKLLADVTAEQAAARPCSQRAQHLARGVARHRLAEIHPAIAEGRISQRTSGRRELARTERVRRGGVESDAR